MNEQEAMEVCYNEAMKRFRIGNEDLTPVIQAAIFGFAAGVEYADVRWR